MTGRPHQGSFRAYARTWNGRTRYTIHPMFPGHRSIYAPRQSFCFPVPVFQDQREAQIYGNEEERMDLLWTLAIILLILWLLGLVTSYTLGGFIHILLVLAIVVVLIRVIQGRRPVL
jgi:hypothetical protein